MRQHAWVLGAIGALLVLATVAMRVTVGVSGGPWSWAGGIGAVLLIAFLWLDRDTVTETAASRSARYSSAAVLLVLVALGVMVALNVLSERHDKRWDITASGRHTLAPQTLAVAEGLTAPVTILGFYGLETQEGVDFDILAGGYAQASERITVERLDPNRDLLTAQQHGVDRMATVVLVQGDRTERLEDATLDEQTLTNALVRLTTHETRTVCFTAGHDERRIDDEDVLGLSALGEQLEQQGTLAVGLTLARAAEVPASCDTVVVADPQTELLAQERETLAAFVRGGGSLMVLLDPAHGHAFAGDLARYGVAVGDDVVVEDNPSYQMVGTDPTYIVLDRASFADHPMVSGGDALSVLRAVRSVGVVEVEGLEAKVVASTSSAAWAETDYLSGTPPQPDPGERVGEVPLITAVEVLDPAAIPVGERSLPAGEPVLVPEGEGESTPEAAPAPPEPPVPGKAGGRVVVFGDSDFISNGLVSNGTNLDLFLNSLAWLLGQEDTVTIRPNEAGRGTLEMTEEQGALVWLLSLLLLPGLAVMGAVGTWLRRRNL